MVREDENSEKFGAELDSGAVEDEFQGSDIGEAERPADAPDASARQNSSGKPKRRRTATVILAAAVLIVSLISMAYYRALTKDLRRVIGAPANYLSKFQKIRFTLEFEKEREKLLTANAAATGREVVSIMEGDIPLQVVKRMKRQGIITDESLFLNYLIYRGIDRRLVPGLYVIHGKVNMIEAANALISAEKRLIKYSVLAGLRLEEIADTLAFYNLKFDRETFLTLARNYPRADHPAGTSSLEGYFLSGHYLIHQGITPEAFIRGILDTFDETVTPEIRDGLAAQGLTLDQGVILASMVTREAAHESEYGLIASVFINRFHAGMKFQCDPTVQYAIGWDEEEGTWWKTGLTVGDLADRSPFNTYVHEGFPPTPISSISLAALKAVADPVPSDFLYFRAACDAVGYHEFSQTYEEHVGKACP